MKFFLPCFHVLTAGNLTGSIFRRILASYVCRKCVRFNVKPLYSPYKIKKGVLISGCCRLKPLRPPNSSGAVSIRCPSGYAALPDVLVYTQTRLYSYPNHVRRVVLYFCMGILETGLAGVLSSLTAISVDF